MTTIKSTLLTNLHTGNGYPVPVSSDNESRLVYCNESIARAMLPLIEVIEEPKENKGELALTWSNANKMADWNERNIMPLPEVEKVYFKEQIVGKRNLLDFIASHDWCINVDAFLVDTPYSVNDTWYRIVHNSEGVPSTVYFNSVDSLREWAGY